MYRRPRLLLRLCEQIVRHHPLLTVPVAEQLGASNEKQSPVNEPLHFIPLHRKTSLRRHNGRVMAGKQLRVQNGQQMNDFGGITIREDSPHNVHGSAFDLKTQNYHVRNRPRKLRFLKSSDAKSATAVQRLVQTEPSGEP